MKKSLLRDFRNHFPYRFFKNMFQNNKNFLNVADYKEFRSS